MRASFRQGNPLETSADTVVVGLFEGDDAVSAQLSGEAAERAGALVASGEAKGKLRSIAIAHPGGDGPARVIVAGLGKREEFDAQRARIAAAVAMSRARDAGARSAAFTVPEAGDAAATARGLTEGALLGAYRF